MSAPAMPDLRTHLRQRPAETEAWRRFAERCFLWTLFFACLPADYVLRLRVLTIPILDGFFFVTGAVVLLAYMAAYRGRSSLVTGYAFGFGYLCVVTGFYSSLPNFDPKAALQDVMAYAGLPTGIALGLLLGKSRFQTLMRRSYLVVSATFAISLILLTLGYIQSVGGDQRLVDPAMYTSSFAIPALAPCVWPFSGGRKRYWRLVTVTGLGLSLFFCMISATRSTLIVTLAASGCIGFIEIKRKAANALWTGTLLAALLLVLLGGSGLQRFESTFLGERLATTDYESEARIEELNAMLDQMGWQEWVHGTGLGYGFESPIALESGTGLSSAPHIGITTLFYKGGVPAVALLMLLPCALGLFGLLFSGFSDRLPFLTGVAIYLLQACLSGGWAFLPLLLFGAFVALGQDRRAQATGDVILGASRGSRSAGNQGAPDLTYSPPPARL